MSSELNDTLPLVDFDQELNLEQLLSPINTVQLHSSLRVFLNNDVCVTNLTGQCLVGSSTDAEIYKSPIRADMEVVGYLETGTNNHEKVNAAVKLIELLLHGSARYLMASSLHLQAVKDDYEKLQEKHQALQQSEAKYRDLADNLEIRVQEQVKTIENRQLQLYQAEKMASVGQLAAGVAHEINNPMGFIKSNLTTAQSYIDDLSSVIALIKNNHSIEEVKNTIVNKDIDFVLEDFQTLLNESAEGAERVSNIVKDLKGFSNIDRSENEVVDLNEVIQGVCNVALPEISKYADLILQFSELPKIECKPAHIGQTVLNMLLNAAKAIKDKGTITITTGFNDGQIEISIEDSGEGIPAEVLPRIFDPFFTTRTVGDGTGLGLSVSHDIIKSHGGEINVESTPGVGTRFEIVLPGVK